MFNVPVALHRLLQAIAWQGNTYEFFRQNENEYKEKAETPEKIADIKGLFHNGSSSHTELKISDSGIVWEKNAPYVMMSWEDSKILYLEDQVTINESLFKVSGKTNVGEFNIICEVSLEKVI